MRKQALYVFLFRNPEVSQAYPDVTTKFATNVSTSIIRIITIISC